MPLFGITTSAQLRRSAVLWMVLICCGCGTGRSPKPSQQGSHSVKERNTALWKVFRNGGELSWPVGYGRVVSAFGPRNSSFHDGLDIASDEGLPVRASHSGKVVYAGSKLSGYGNLVILRHPSGLLTVYAHNRKILVEVGDNIHRGMTIALLGQTGHASGPHVHFEVRIKDKLGRYVAVDPAPLLSPNGGKPRYRVNESLTPLLANLWPFSSRKTTAK